MNSYNTAITKPGKGPFTLRTTILILLAVLVVIAFLIRDFFFSNDLHSNNNQGDGAVYNEVNSNLIYEETFENIQFFPREKGLMNTTRGIENCNNNGTDNPSILDWTLKRVDSPVYRGSHAVRFEVRKDQPLVGSSQRVRSEVVIIQGTTDERFTPDIWYSFDILFPSKGMEYDRQRDCINQWWEDGSDETTIRCQSNKAFLEVTPPEGSKNLKMYDLFAPQHSSDGTLDSFEPIPKDEWHEFVFHFIHSFNDNGLIEVWRDGKKIHTIKGRNMHKQFPKWKIGLYKAGFRKSERYSRIVYFDNIRVGKSGSSLTDMTSSAK